MCSPFVFFAALSLFFPQRVIRWCPVMQPLLKAGNARQIKLRDCHKHTTNHTHTDTDISHRHGKSGTITNSYALNQSPLIHLLPLFFFFFTISERTPPASIKTFSLKNSSSLCHLKSLTLAIPRVFLFCLGRIGRIRLPLHRLSLSNDSHSSQAGTFQSLNGQSKARERLSVPATDDKMVAARGSDRRRDSSR